MKSKIITLEKLENGDSFLKLEDIQDLVDISKIEFCEIVPNENDCIVLRFYDKNKELINPIVGL